VDSSRLTRSVQHRQAACRGPGNAARGRALAELSAADSPPREPDTTVLESGTGSLSGVRPGKVCSQRDVAAMPRAEPGSEGRQLCRQVCPDSANQPPGCFRTGNQLRVGKGKKDTCLRYLRKCGNLSNSLPKLIHPPHLNVPCCGQPFGELEARTLQSSGGHLGPSNPEGMTYLGNATRVALPNLDWVQWAPGALAPIPI
jgi:hypothetical protein